MAKATKTWKIGEACRGGIITVEITGKIITVIGKEWDTSAGYSRGSNQSNAKEWTRGTGQANDANVETKLFMFLTELTTAYYASQIIDWIKSKVKFEVTSW